VELSAEAIRLTRQLHEQLPAEGEVAGLLALMLLTDARRPARTSADGALVPLPEQDRSLWNAAFVAEGTELIAATLKTAPVGPYQLQAAIAAVHGEAARAEDTDWRQILVLYELLETLAPGPMVSLNRIVAVAMVHGPEVGLSRLEQAATDPALKDHHRVEAVRAHLLELAGDLQAAREAYLLAAQRTLSLPEQRYLSSRAESLAQ
jgi:predicted RNA polymerase sigma factor